jgi:uncharacterized cupin superfamily protein
MYVADDSRAFNQPDCDDCRCPRPTTIDLFLAVRGRSMQRVSLDDVATDRQALTEPLGTTDLAINRYRLPPGEGLPAGLHAHADQEEVFVVSEGTARFETLVRETGEWRADEVRVDAGEAIRFAPGEFQSGHSVGDEPLVALALGAPRDSEDVRLPVTCPNCDRPDLRLDTDGEPTFRCPDCDGAFVPAPCPECGSEALRVALGEDRATVVVCDDCAATFPEPPLSEYSNR